MENNKINIKELWDAVFNEMIELDSWDESYNNNEFHRYIYKITQIAKILEFDGAMDVIVKYYNIDDVNDLIKKVENLFKLITDY